MKVGYQLITSYHESSRDPQVVWCEILLRCEVLRTRGDPHASAHATERSVCSAHMTIPTNVERSSDR